MLDSVAANWSAALSSCCRLGQRIVAVQAKPLGGDTRMSWASLTRPGELLGPRLADARLTAWFRDSYLMRAWCGA
jgi:hypothetical protein